MRHVLLAFTIGLCALACIATASEASAEEPASEGDAAYRELIDQALSEFRHRNWPEARVLFRRAHDLHPNARTLRGMGIVSYEMRDYVAAVVALSGALSDSRQPLTDAQRKECETLLGRARTFVGSYALSVEPPGAELRLDGAQLVRDADGRALVPFGEHTLDARADGYTASTSRLSVQGGEQGELRIVLYPPQASPTPVRSSIEKRTEEEPQRVLAAHDEGAEEPASARGFRGHGLRYTWVALGASAAFGAVAAVAWPLGQREVDDLAASCDASAARGAPCVRGQVDTDRVQRFERLTNAMIGLAAAGVAATAVLMVLEWPREREPARKLALSLAPQQLSIAGRF